MALEALDRRVQELEREENADYVVYKEFDGTDGVTWSCLSSAGICAGRCRCCTSWPDVFGISGSTSGRSRRDIEIRLRVLRKLEFLPLEFFRELPEHVDAMFVEDMTAGGRVVGFTLAMRANGTHYNVYSGVDYEMNERAHIYFNLFYHDLDHAFSIGTTEVHLGETSDGCKSRLGDRDGADVLLCEGAQPCCAAD
jgi:hypothetical protein